MKKSGGLDGRDIVLRVRSEEALVRACAGGERAAWSEFVTLYSGWAVRVARATFRRAAGRANEADVEDAVAEVFRQLLDRDAAMLRGLRPPFHLRAWLAVVVRRSCLRLLRRKPPPLPATSAPRAPDPELAEALATLPAEDRLLLELFFTQEASYEEIAQALGISVDSVGKQKFRALQKLKEILKQRGIDA